MFLRGFDIVLHKTPLNKRPDSCDTSQPPYASDMRESFQHAYFVGRIDCLVFRMPRAIIATHQAPIYGGSWMLNRGAPRIYVHLAASLLPVLNPGETRQCARSLPLLHAFCRLWVTSQLAVPTIIPTFFRRWLLFHKAADWLFPLFPEGLKLGPDWIQVSLKVSSSFKLCCSDLLDQTATKYRSAVVGALLEQVSVVGAWAF